MSHKPACSSQQSPGWLREPLLHFLVLAGALFALDYVITQGQKEQIVVDRQTVDFLIQQREDLVLRALSAGERQQIIDAYVDDEILYSEAYRRGLDRGDSRMRRNLIYKMRGLLGGEVDDPTDEQMRAFYAQNPARFTIAQAWSLEQIFFKDSSTIPDRLQNKLRDGLDPLNVGDKNVALRRTLPNVSKRGLIDGLGPQAARAVLAIEDDQWHGPIESALGVHYIRIIGSRAAHQQPFDTVKRYIEGEWALVQTRARIERELDRLRDHYEIVIENADPHK